MEVAERMVLEAELRVDWRRVLMTDMAVNTSGPATVRKIKLGGAFKTWQRLKVISFRHIVVSLHYASVYYTKRHQNIYMHGYLCIQY